MGRPRTRIERAPELSSKLLAPDSKRDLQLRLRGVKEDETSTEQLSDPLVPTVSRSRMGKEKGWCHRLGTLELHIVKEHQVLQHTFIFLPEWQAL